MSKKYYEDYWKLNKIEPGSHLPWKKEILGSLKLFGNNFLDVGCGDGYIASQFVNKFKTYGIDISEVALKEANAKGIITQQLDANKIELPFEDEFFDNISCLDILEHIIDPIAFTKEIYRILKKDGIFIVSVPNILNIINRFHFLFGNFVDVMDVAHKNNELFSEHIKMFSKDKLEKLLHKTNFKILKRYFYFPKKFNEPKWRKFQIIGDIFNIFKIPCIMPSLFALGLLYVCKK